VLPRRQLGYIVLSATMIAAALIELIWGVAAERRPLEDVARPLHFRKVIGRVMKMAARKQRIYLHRRSLPGSRSDQIDCRNEYPARLDRLPWGRFPHARRCALGITWIFDGLEVTLAGALSGALKASPILHFSNTDVGLAAGAYLVARYLALCSSAAHDRLGRKKAVFCDIIGLSASNGRNQLLLGFLELLPVPLLTGAGIGGEYTAITPPSRSLIPRGVSPAAPPCAVSTCSYLDRAQRSRGGVPSCCSTPSVFDPEIRLARCLFLIGAALAASSSSFHAPMDPREHRAGPDDASSR